MTSDEPRWLTDEQQRAWRQWLLLTARLPARLNRQLLADSELSLPDFDVLVHLTDVDSGRLRVLELGRALQWEKSRLSHHLTRMERRGLVRREDCAADGRGFEVVVTDAGLAALRAAAPAHVETVQQLVFDGLSAAQVRAMADIADTVLARLGD
ncbi:MarR family transcriptional regulator [Modestobacter sp. I12A-02628]|uniref:MarR family transcriptional regulator n=1 Tax=Goekera deserti TaxID=2497753 RepID=A0A7K3W839_9ACTN|nr:MarR family transcriptional regulator [Goekera deserti]MPQ99868.1 MarR family transcriptional regulator [Goekera deserti]NDI50027.1 MarR family transcriptional regulator [Goekera deserti]NEL52496.1 MarR family transcriptional regulator [Goekera deserti]